MIIDTTWFNYILGIFVGWLFTYGYFKSKIKNMDRCCKNPKGYKIPVGKDGYICQKCSDETHEEVCDAVHAVGETGGKGGK